MGRDIAEASRAARAVYEAADATLGWPVSATCWDGPEERLNDTRQTQPCLLTTSIACLRALGDGAERAGVPLRAAYAAGHSVGEYAALVASGALELEPALRLVARRASLMARAGKDGGMAAVIGLERDVVAHVVARVGRPTELVVANDNAPGQVVISGSGDAVAAAHEPLRAAGARRVLSLPVSGAFHSPLMTQVADELAAAFESETWSDASPPVVSNVTAEPVTDAQRIRALLAEQVRSPVEWVRCVERMVADGVDTFVECGPGSALIGMVRRIAPGARLASVNDVATLTATIELLASATPAQASA